jgi:hypothetical protein
MDTSSFAPKTSPTFSYTNNDLSQFMVPLIIAIISVIGGFTIYAATKSIKK